MIKKIILFLAILSLTGCITTTSSTSIGASDSSGSEIKPINYSRYFQGESTLVEGAIQLNAVAKINWRKPTEEKKPSDADSELVNTDIKINLYNTTQQNIDLQINSLQLNNDEKIEYMIIQPEIFRLIPQTVERLTKKDYLILNSNTEIILNMQYTWNGKQISSKIILKRLTTLEVKGRKDLPNIF